MEGPGKGLRLAVAAFVISVMLFVVVIGGAIFLRVGSEQQTCEAIRDNNSILRELVTHIEHRSLISIREGVTADISPADVRAFYQPTLRRIDGVSC